MKKGIRMIDDNRYETIIQQSLKTELRFLNAQLPVKQKSLHELLDEEIPSVSCTDGSRQLMKRKELKRIADILPQEQWKDLRLPIILEISSGEDIVSVVYRNESEANVLSSILAMPLSIRNGRIFLHKVQLAVIRKHLKTTTQYMFSPKTVQ